MICIYSSGVFALCHNSYDAKGNLIEEKCEEEWGGWGTKYDQNGRVIEEYSSSGNDDWQYSSGNRYVYDESGKKTSSIYFEKETGGSDPYNYEEKTTYEYNDAGKLIKEYYDDGETTGIINYELDSHGNWIKQTTSYSDGYEHVSERSYDYYDNGNIKAMYEAPYGIIEEYDESGLKTKEYMRNSCSGCDGPGIISEFSRLDKSFEYDEKGRLIRENDIAQAGCDWWYDYCFDYIECYSEYGYDEKGNLNKEIKANTGGWCTYESDGYYRCEKNYMENVYDKNGKMLATYRGGTNISNTDPQTYTSRILVYTYDHDKYGNLIAKYDADGNLVGTYTYKNPTYNTVMRIYTVKEATLAADGNNNTFSIRYK